MKSSFLTRKKTIWKHKINCTIERERSTSLNARKLVTKLRLICAIAREWGKLITWPRGVIPVRLHQWPNVETAARCRYRNLEALIYLHHSLRDGEKRSKKIKAGRKETTRIRRLTVQPTLSPTRQYNKHNWPSITKQKGKGLPPTNMPCRHRGRAQVGLESSSFLTSALRGVGWQSHTPTALPPTLQNGRSRQLYKR
jgi:hypothetical protein